jgi:hypothetical protein
MQRHTINNCAAIADFSNFSAFPFHDPPLPDGPFAGWNLSAMTQPLYRKIIRLFRGRRKAASLR